MDKEEFADDLLRLFPDKANSFAEHYKDYGELLGHIFFASEISEPLILLMHRNHDTEKIKIYCAFIEKMWSHGTADVQNIVEVTILERLSDEENVWFRFGENISSQFKQYINDCVIQENGMMWTVPKLR